MEKANDVLASLHPDLQSHIPHDNFCISALETGFTALPKPIFNHSLRVFLIAKWLAAKENSEWVTPQRLPLLFTACMCHDFGTCDLYNGEQRFEVEGADAAVKLLKDSDVSADDCKEVWCAIALHTSAGIAERLEGIVRLTRIAVKIDFSPVVRTQYGADHYAQHVEDILPRLNIEKVLADAVVAQAAKIAEVVNPKTWPDSLKHPKASWPGILLRAHLENPEHDGVNYAF